MALIDNLVVGYKLSDITDVLGGTSLTNTGTTAFNAGLIGNAADFGASNTTKALNRTPSFLSYAEVGTAFTFSCWVNITTLSATNRVIRFILNNGSLERNFTLDTSTDNKPIFITFDGSVHLVTATSALSGSAWHHIVCRYNGTQSLWIDGASVGTPLTYSWSGYSRNTFSNFCIGAEQLNAGAALSVNFSGLIDEFYVWNRGISDSEITQLYNAGAGLTYPFATSTFIPRIIIC